MSGLDDWTAEETALYEAMETREHEHDHHSPSGSCLLGTCSSGKPGKAGVKTGPSYSDRVTAKEAAEKIDLEVAEALMADVNALSQPLAPAPTQVDELAKAQTLFHGQVTSSGTFHLAQCKVQAAKPSNHPAEGETPMTN
jgi:hypothetical protein